MIHALSWFTPLDHGVLTTRSSWSKPSPAVTATDAITTLLGRPVKHFARMTGESQAAVCAAALALQGADWAGRTDMEIGLLSSDDQGSLEANLQYFRDYHSSGRTMGRGALFIYTLPTSVLGAVSIAMSLAGPALHLRDDRAPMNCLLDAGHAMIGDGDADAVLALWCDPHAAVCAAIGPPPAPAPGDADSVLDALWIHARERPVDLARLLHSRVRTT